MTKHDDRKYSSQHELGNMASIPADQSKHSKNATPITYRKLTQKTAGSSADLHPVGSQIADFDFGDKQLKNLLKHYHQQ